MGYSHNFIFDESSDERGFWLFADGLWQTPQNTSLPLMQSVGANWSEDHRYVIGYTTDYDSAFLGERQQNGVVILRDDLPIVSLDGVWAADQYFTQMGTQVVKIMASSGEVVDLGIQLSEGMELFGWQRMMGK